MQVLWVQPNESDNALWIAGELYHSDVCSCTSTSGRGWKMRLKMVTHCYGLIGAALFLGGCATPRTVATAPPPEPIVERWRGVTVAAEHRCAPYRCDEYAYPPAVEDDIIRQLGGLFSPYTGAVFDSKGDTDIEHVVARSEAHDSGLCRADAATKRRFSRDLLNLTLASPRVNRNQKGAKDAAEWQPEANQCWFAQTVVVVRRAYRLTIDRREADAIDRILAGC